MERAALITSLLSLVFLIGHSAEVDGPAPGTKEFYYLLGKKEFISDQIFLISLYSQAVNSSTVISQSQGSQAFQQVIKSQVAVINEAVEKVKGTDAERCTPCLQSQVEDIIQTVGRDIAKCLQPLATATFQLEKSLYPIEKELKENYSTLNVSYCYKITDEEAKYDCILTYLSGMYAFIANKSVQIDEKRGLVEVLMFTDVTKCFTNSASTGVKAINVAIAGLNACSDAAGIHLKLPVFPAFVDKISTAIEEAKRRFNRKGLAKISAKFIEQEENLKIFLSQAYSIVNDKAEDFVLSSFNSTLASVNSITGALANTQYSYCNRNAQSQLKSIISRVKEDLIRCAEELINKGRHLQNNLVVTKSIIKQHLIKYGYSSIVLCLLNDPELFVNSEINSCSQNILDGIVGVKATTLRDIEALGIEISSLTSNIENCEKLVIQARKRAENVLASLKQCARI